MSEKTKEQDIHYDEKQERKKRNRKYLFLGTFLSAVLLIVATYAWLSTTLNVKINFFKMQVASDSGLFISLDGIDFSESVVISMESVISELRKTYPNHTNQWAVSGLWPVSTNGIVSPNHDKFDVYMGILLRTKAFNPNGSTKRILNTLYMSEEQSLATNSYIAFDVFMKNASGSPKSDNLYFEQNTKIDYDKDVDDETKVEMQGIMNSVRIGIVQIGSVPHRTPVGALQNLTCQNQCKALIYEPFHLDHSEGSIETAENYGVTLVDGVYTPTYGIIAEGTRLEHTNGHPGTGLALDTEHFALQETINVTDIMDPIFEIPNGLSKYRVYVWIEGQDIDSLETYSKGAAIDVVISFIKDLAGYE